METREFSEDHDNVKTAAKDIVIPEIRLRNLDQVEALITELQGIARLTWGPRKVAMGTSSMLLTKLIGKLQTVDRPDKDLFAAITMAGNIEIYEGDVLQGFVEVRQGGGFFPV